MTNKEGITQELETFLQELKEYQYCRLLQANNKATRAQIANANNLRDKLLRDAGRFRSLIAELTGKEKVKVTRLKNGREYEYDLWFTALKQLFNLRAADAISYCIDVTSAAIGRLESDIKKGIRDTQGNVIRKPSTVPSEPPKAFIAHGGKSEAQDKLCQFLTALGVTPLIVEEQPSEGRSVGENVDHYARQADCAIILATKGDIDSKTGRFIPRGNVLIEIGKAQEVFKDRIIYLLQAGTKFPTDISEKVRERFTSQNMDKAFIKIAKELTKFGILRAVKP
jgi:predicted nucleotide-binding protein